MIYIKENPTGIVDIAGEVANQTMLDSGYVQYNGTVPAIVPEYQHYELDVNGALVAVTDTYEEQVFLYLKRKEDMLTGQVYTLNAVDYGISLTSKDASGVMQVYLANQSGGITTTNISFENGTVLPLAAAEIPAFVTWFISARQMFFTTTSAIVDPRLTNKP